MQVLACGPVRSTLLQHFLASVGSSLSACAELDTNFSADESENLLCSAGRSGALQCATPTPTVLELGKPLCLPRNVICPIGWMLQHGMLSLGKQVLWSKQFFTLKLQLGAGPFLQLSHVVSVAWSRQPSRPNFGSGCPCQKPMLMYGVPAVMGSLTNTVTTQPTCIAGGERTQRHHAVRDLVCHWATKAGLRPQAEAPHLLLPQSPDDFGSGRRRPADIFIPALAGSPTALDFAVTAHTRQETLAIASTTPGAAAAAYAQHKAAYLATAQTCQKQGIRFLPMGR